MEPLKARARGARTAPPVVPCVYRMDIERISHMFDRTGTALFVQGFTAYSAAAPRRALTTALTRRSCWAQRTNGTCAWPRAYLHTKAQAARLTRPRRLASPGHAGSISTDLIGNPGFVLLLFLRALRHANEGLRRQE